VYYPRPTAQLSTVACMDQSSNSEEKVRFSVPRTIAVETIGSKANYWLVKSSDSCDAS